MTDFSAPNYFQKQIDELTDERDNLAAENVRLREQVRALVGATEWVVRAAREVDQSAAHSEKPYWDLVHSYAMESLHAALAEYSNPEVQP